MLELGAPEENESVTRGETLELGAPEEDNHEEKSQPETDDAVENGVQEELLEEAVEDACVDVNDEEPVPQDAHPARTTRSGRNVRHHNYKNISRDDIQIV